MNANDIASDIKTAQEVGNTILDAIESIDPGAAVPAEATETILNLAEQFAIAALIAYSNASGAPITPDTIAALMPNPTSLSTPSA